MSLGMFFTLQFFWSVWGRLAICLVELIGMAIWSFVGRISIIDSVSLFIVGLFRFAFLHDSVLVMFLRIYLFLLGCPVYWCIIVRGSPLYLSYVCAINFNVSSFILVLFIWILSFISLFNKYMLTLFICLKNQHLVSISFLLSTLVSILYVFTLVFVIYFLL